MQPLQRPAHPHAGLIGMGERRPGQRLANGGHRRLKAHRGRLHGVYRLPGEMEMSASSSNNAAVRSKGSSWYCVRYTANADTPGPYCTGARMSSGKSLRCQPPAGTGPGPHAVLGDLAADHQFDDLAPLRQRLGRNLRAAATAGTSAIKRHDQFVGLLHQGACRAPTALLPAGFAPARLTLGARGRFAKRGSEEGSLLALWLSLRRRASNSSMRRRCCSMIAACSATRARSRSITSSKEWVAVFSSDMARSHANRWDCLTRGPE